MIIKCDNCPKQFYIRPSHYKRSVKHNCSVVCQGLGERGEKNHRWKNNYKECLICKKVFKPIPHTTVHCSRKCGQVKKTITHRKETKCTICGKIITVILALYKETNTCSRRCADILHSKRMQVNGNSNWRGGIGNLPWHYDFNKKLKKNIKDRDKNVCRLCNKNNEELPKKKGYGITIHHIDYNKNNNNHNNLISLCNFCHGRANYNKELWQPKLSQLLGG